MKKFLLYIRLFFATLTPFTAVAYTASTAVVVTAVVVKVNESKKPFEAAIIRYEQFGVSGQYAWIYIPENWSSYADADKAAIIYFGGAGARGTGTDTSHLDSEGPSRYIRDGQRPRCIVIQPQLTAGASIWTLNYGTATRTHLINNYGVNSSRIGIDGYSLGYTMVMDLLKSYPSYFSAAHGLAGDYEGGGGWGSAQADSISKVPIYLSHYSGDGTQPINNSRTILDSVLNPNHTLPYLPMTDFEFGGTHGSSDEAVYANYASGVAAYLLLHHKNADTTAMYFVDSLERSEPNVPLNMFTRAEGLVNKLSASAHKTSLLSRLTAVKNSMNGGSDYVAAWIDLGVSGKTSSGNINNITNLNSGQSISNIIDETGAATTWDFHVVTRANTTEEADVGLPRGYWKYDEPNLYDDHGSVFSISSALWEIRGLNAGNYTIRMSSCMETFSAGTKYGSTVTVDGSTKSIDFVYKNTDKYLEWKGITVADNGTIQISPDGIVTNSVTGINFIQIIKEGTGASSVTVSAGNDTTYPYDQANNTPPFTLTATASGGTPGSYAWTQISGPNTATITSASSATTTVSGATKGYYKFRNTLDNGAYDEVEIWIRDYNEAGIYPSRVGGGRKVHVGNTLISGVVSTTWIDLAYYNRDLPLGDGEPLIGGDTLVIHKNPNNGGVWNTIVMGGFGGNAEDSVVIMFDTVGVQWRDYFRLASGTDADTNFVNYVKIDGLCNRVGSQNVYSGWGIKTDSTGSPFVIHFARNLEICGIYTFGGTWLIKRDADSTKPWGIYNNYNPGPYYIHDVYATSSKISNPGGEIFYIGNTYPDGALHPGDGAICQLDTVRLDRIIVTRSGWDAIQVSWCKYVTITNCVTRNTGMANQSSQQFSIFMGGYTNGYIRYCVMGKASGGAGVLGRGANYFEYNIVDSVINGGASDYDNLYITQTTVSTPPPLPDSLIVYTRYNIFSRMENTAVRAPNYSGRMKAGEMKFNIAVHPTKNQSQLFQSSAGDVISNNTIVTALDIDTTSLAQSLPAWAVYKLVSADETIKYSFFDVETSEGGSSRGYLLRIKGKRLRRNN